MTTRMQKARGLNISDGKWKKRVNIISSEVARILTSRTSFPSTHNVNGCQGSFPSSFWCGEGYPTVTLACFELAGEGMIPGSLAAFAEAVCSNAFCSNLLLLAAISTEVNSIEFGADTGVALQQTLPELESKKVFFVVWFFFNLLGFFRDEWCFMYSSWWLQCLACLLSVWKGFWKGEGICSIA